MSNDVSMALNPTVAKVLAYYINQKNREEINHAQGEAVIKDPHFGDPTNICIAVEDDKIADFEYKIFGDNAAISVLDTVLHLAIGKSLREAAQITADDVIAAYSDISTNERYVSLLAIEGLRGAIVHCLAKDNHRKFEQRLVRFRSSGYDITEARMRLVKFFLDFPADAKILDIGTGKGHLSMAIARNGRKCISIDLSAEEIQYARLNAIYEGLDKLIDFRLANAKKMDFPTESFDCIVTANFFHHVDQPEPVLKEMLRVCKVGGKLIITDLNERGFKFMDSIFQQEGRMHTKIGWQIGELGAWFAHKYLNFATYSDKFEDILIVTKND